MVISCSYTDGVSRYINTLVNSGVIDQVIPLCFMYEPYFTVPTQFNVFKQNTKYLGNKAARLPLLKLIDDGIIKQYDWIIWTDCQDIVFQNKLSFNNVCNIDASAFICPENTLHKDTSFWKPILDSSDEFRCLLNEPVYNSGCFAMTGKSIKSYFDALSIPSYTNRYGPYRYDGDQLIFNKWILDNKKDCICDGDFFGCLYASYTGSEWKDGNLNVTTDKERQTIDILNGRFINKSSGNIISIIHAPGSSKLVLNQIYPIPEQNKDKNKNKNIDVSVPIIQSNTVNKNNISYSDSCLKNILHKEESENSMESTENIKYGAVLVVYNEEPTIAYCIKSIYSHVDHIIVTTSDYTWSGVQQPLDQTVNIIKNFPDPEHKIQLIKGRWDRDDYARNDALDILEKLGCHFSLIVDGDELWDSKDLMKLKLVAASSNKDVFRCAWYTYWKDINHRIDPPENFLPVVMVKTNKVRFNWVREVCFKSYLPDSSRTLQDKYRIGYDHPSLFNCGTNVLLHHLSWVRSDTDAKAKIEKSPHLSEFIPNWYENVWLAWNNNTSLENLHPTYPAQFKRAIQLDKSQIPEVVSKNDIQYTVVSEDDHTVIGVNFLPSGANEELLSANRELMSNSSSGNNAASVNNKDTTATDSKKPINEISLDELKKNGRVSKETVINYFTNKFTECRYLEIGSQHKDNFIKINAWIKHDCEENPRGTTPHFKGTSNEFFTMLDELKLNSVYDVVFVDGMHKCEQVLRDIVNASKHLSVNGYIVVHDCLPKEYPDQLRELTEENKKRWLGDCYRAIAYLVDKIDTNKNIVFTLENTDQGCAIIKGPLQEFTMPAKEDLCNDYTWRKFIQEKTSMMNCVEWVKFIENN